ncbi:nitrate- and nitrite sensing domain-containing protein [Streptomyces sp. B6B3]|uniref:sensor histidine kinase n=1 Tax=Streptomyces sp. B6B3 TaxID=3153570 RepID=UPI00325F03C7
MSGIRDRHNRVPRAFRKSLRLSLALPVLIAALALTGLWGYVASGLAREGLQLRDDASLAESVGDPAHTMVARLQDERRLTAAWQARPTETTRDALNTARSATDTAVEEFRATGGGLDAARSAVRDRAGTLETSLTALTGSRGAIDGGAATNIEAFRSFTTTVGNGIALIEAASRVDDWRLTAAATATADLMRIAEMLSREDALQASVPSGEDPSAAVREEFAQALALQRESRLSLNPLDLPDPQAEVFSSLTGSPRWDALVAAEDPEASGTVALPPAEGEWREAVDVVDGELRQLSTDSLASMATDGDDRGMRLLLVAAVGTFLAALVLALAILLAWRSIRSVVGRLNELRASAREQADTALPQMLEQLGREQRVDPTPQARDRDYGGDEVGQLADTMDEQWRLVVDTIVQQARGREGTETVFLGLARRTQILINRMIPKIDKLEREHQDSRLLKEIFGVDHLATRVRRHTENLLILGGALPARRWGKPVPIYEVMRSAISETEDYSRVDALPAPKVSLVGRAVADVVHLLAELIENGTSFSPPKTKVSVSAEVVARGRLALEVVDRGLGMSEEEYERVNTLLADPPKLDMMTLGEAPRLGLFVVARLAKRHGLEVSLRRSPYGGTLAVVLLPSELLEEAKSLLSGIMADAAQNEAKPNGDARRARPVDEVGKHPVEDREEPEADEALPIRTRDNTGVPGDEWELPLSAPAPAPEPAPLPIPAPATSGGLMDAPIGGGLVDAPAGGGPVEEPAFTHIEYDHSGYPAYGGAGLLPSTFGTPGTPPEDPSQPMARTHPPVDRVEHVEHRDPMGHMDRYSQLEAQREQTAHREPTGLPEPSTTGLPVRTAASGHAAVDQPASSGHPTGDPAPRDRTAGTERFTPGDDEPPRESLQTSGSLRLPIRVRGESLAEPLRMGTPPSGDPENDPGARRSPDRAGATMAAIQSGNKRARAAKPAQPTGGPDSQAGTPGHVPEAEGPARKDQ